MSRPPQRSSPLLTCVLVLTLVLAGCMGSAPAPSDGADPADGSDGHETVASPPEPTRLAFSDVTKEAGVAGCPGNGTSASEPAAHGRGAGWGDHDGDGDPDLYVACDGPNLLYRNDGNGSFTEVASDAGVAGDANTFGVAWGDMDGDGCLDLYVVNHGDGGSLNGSGEANVLYRNRCDGTFEDVTDASNASHPGDHSTSAAWVDHDLDGDLDLYVANRGVVARDGGFRSEANRLYENRNGSFTDVAEEAGVAGPARTGNVGSATGRSGLSEGVVWFDRDGDGFQELFVAESFGVSPLYQNLGGEYEEVTGEAGLERSGVSLGADAGDMDQDGDADLLVTTRSGSLLWRNEYQDPARRGTFTLVSNRSGLVDEGGSGGAGAGFQDLDSDGDLDLLATHGPADASGAGWVRVLQNLGNGTFRNVTGAAGAGNLTGLGAAAFADHDLDGDVDAYVTHPGAPGRLLRNDAPQSAWLKLRLEGNMSNRGGVGAFVEVVDGNHTWTREARAGSGFRSTDSATVHVGVGNREAVDAVRIFWPSGAHQVLLNVTTNETIPIVESNTEKTSCPLLFGWTGDGFSFGADVLGNAYSGWLVAPGTHMRPDPTERFRFDGLEPRNGAYELRIGEVLEEHDFLDRVALTAVDHPPGVDVVPREAFRLEQRHEGYGLVPLVDPQPVASATTGDGRDVTGLVTERDGDSPEVPRIANPRFDGYAEPHELVVDLGNVSDAERVQLAAYGWIYYPMTIPSLVAEGPYVEPQPPTLEARDPETGEWVTVMEEMGFPAGTPKWMTADLSGKLPEGAHVVRITTNLQVHWDQILVDTGSADVPMETHTVTPSSAELRFLGYPTYVDRGPQEPGSYRYDVRAPSHVWDVPRGNVTRYGDVTELLQERDDRFVVFPHGDEVRIRFDADALPPLREGWTRTLFVDLDGFFKDMEPYNAHPDTVGPYPFHGMSNYPYGPDESYPRSAMHQTYLETYQTRRIG